MSSKACPVCEKVFTKTSNLNRHVTMHSSSSLTCPYCPASLKGQDSLATHLRSFHNEQRHGQPAANSTQSGGSSMFECPQCPEMFGRRNLIISHLKNVHDLDAPFETHHFTPEPAFNAWKDSLPKGGFAAMRAKECAKDGTLTQTFVCRRSNETLGQSTSSKRSVMKHERCKLECKCLARITATYSPDGSVQATYLTMHTGHDPDNDQLCFTRIPASTRALIINLLIRKVPHDEIIRICNRPLSDRHSRDSAVQDSSRDMWVTAQDVRNCAARLKKLTGISSDDAVATAFSMRSRTSIKTETRR
ncbi:unnamed protein product (mitochondrion) [Plasmodiophora brassicae]|uniref:C2H2-type domain-containing protein n=1 Tax=Plasmodiophora brassicae TaxID=37360 RepID=A0A0G4IID4_PLABS|nr:hypothetical protein PBRA_003786 [Plasmodiophora brassicae]SPQ94304.1 unnamed protein product [Plasmodiophora brassicae]